MFDVAIIGGGINGLGTARDLAKRGLSVYLAEKNDFGVGATGNSSGMIHGGIRYMLSDVGITRDSCTDSGYIQNISKNLIFRIPFLMPVYESRNFARAFLSLGEVFFEAYDDFQPLKNGKKHGRLTAEETLKIEPGLAHKGLLGAVTTDDWGVDSYRLCALNALDARANGAVIENHRLVTGLLRSESGAVRGLVTDKGDVEAKLVLNCTGAWNGHWSERRFGTRVAVRPGKGVHLVFDARISDYALITFGIDGRQVFLMPHQNESWFGTTDDDFFGDPDDLAVSKDDVEYLMRAGEHVFPDLRKYRCFAANVGLRPTTFDWGPNEDDLSREHEIINHDKDGMPGMLSIIGGKLASYRHMSEEFSDRALEILGRPAVPCHTARDPLPGHEKLVDPMPLAGEFSIDPLAARRLVRRHGTQAKAILREGMQSQTGLSTVCACEPVLECEVRHAIRNEWVENAADLGRRCRVGRGPCLGLRCAARVGQIFAEEKNADAVQVALQVAGLAKERAAPVLTPALQMQVERTERALHEYGGA